MAWPLVGGTDLRKSFLQQSTLILLVNIYLVNVFLNQRLSGRINHYHSVLLASAVKFDYTGDMVCIDIYKLLFV